MTNAMTDEQTRPMTLLDIPRTLAPDAAPPATAHPLPAPARPPLALLAAIGEQIAASALALQEGRVNAQGEGMRLERQGLQLQALAQVIGRAGQLRQESVDLGLALLQTLAEWSAEADRCGIDLHGPACSVLVQANPAALKHLLDLLVEHALQQGRTVRLDVQAVDGHAGASVVVHVDASPASRSPERETLAWQLLLMLARSLQLAPERHIVPGGERLVLPLPRSLG